MSGKHNFVQGVDIKKYVLIEFKLNIMIIILSIKSFIIYICP